MSPESICFTFGTLKKHNRAYPKNYQILADALRDKKFPGSFSTSKSLIDVSAPPVAKNIPSELNLAHLTTLYKNA